MTLRTLSTVGHPQYQLSSGERRRLTDSLFDRHAAFLLVERPTTEPLLCVAVDGRDPISNLGRCLEQEVFDDEAGDHSIDVMHLEYGNYEDRSLFFLGLDLRTREVTGCVRVITGSAGFGPSVKTIQDCLSRTEFVGDGEIDLRDGASVQTFPGWRDGGRVGRHREGLRTEIDRQYVEQYHSMQPGDVVFDLATAVVPKRIRDHEKLTMSLLLYSAAFKAAQTLNAKHGVTVVRADLLDLWRSVLMMDWENLAGFPSIEYVDGDPFLSQPAYISFRELDSQVHRALLEDATGKSPLDSSPLGRFVRLMGDPRLETLTLQES